MASTRKMGLPRSLVEVIRQHYVHLVSQEAPDIVVLPADYQNQPARLPRFMQQYKRAWLLFHQYVTTSKTYAALGKEHALSAAYVAERIRWVAELWATRTGLPVNKYHPVKEIKGRTLKMETWLNHRRAGTPSR